MDLAFANHTLFGVNDFGTILKMDVLIQNYSYSKDIASMTSTNPNSFFTAVRNQINNEMPVLLSFPEPHVGVIDDYSLNPMVKRVAYQLQVGRLLGNTL